MELDTSLDNLDLTRSIHSAQNKVATIFSPPHKNWNWAVKQRHTGENLENILSFDTLLLEFDVFDVFPQSSPQSTLWRSFPGRWMTFCSGKWRLVAVLQLPTLSLSFWLGSELRGGSQLELQTKVRKGFIIIIMVPGAVESATSASTFKNLLGALSKIVKFSQTFVWISTVNTQGFYSELVSNLLKINTSKGGNWK